MNFFGEGEVFGSRREQQGRSREEMVERKQSLSECDRVRRREGSDVDDETAARRAWTWTILWHPLRTKGKGQPGQAPTRKDEEGRERLEAMLTTTTDIPQSCRRSDRNSDDCLA